MHAHRVTESAGLYRPIKPGTAISLQSSRGFWHSASSRAVGIIMRSAIRLLTPRSPGLTAAASASTVARSISVTSSPARTWASRRSAAHLARHLQGLRFGYFDDEAGRVEPIADPFGSKVLEMCSE